MYFVNSFVTIFKMKFENFKGIKRDFFIRKKKQEKVIQQKEETLIIF
jgi:hypothetical protein